MPFPTSGEMAAFAALMQYRSLEDLLRKRAPEYAERIERPDTQPLFLKIRLDDGGSGVMLHFMSRLPGAWIISDLQSALIRPRVWGLDTPPEILVDALKARAAARLADVPEPAPWRWDEATESAQTKLADLLGSEGFDVTSVVAGNRVASDGSLTRDGYAVRIAPRSEGGYVRANFGKIQVHVALKPALGWIADVLMPDDLQWRRLDLGQLLTGQPSVMPGVPAGSLDVPLLARTLAEAVAPLLVPPDDRSPSTLLAGDLFPPASSARSDSEGLAPFVAAQLRAMAFGDIEPWEDPVTPLRSQSFHIVWRGNQDSGLGRPDLERFNGIAAAAGKSLLVLNAGGASRPALSFSNEAKAFVFRLDPSYGILRSGNDRSAEAHLTNWTEWIAFCTTGRRGS